MTAGFSGMRRRDGSTWQQADVATATLPQRIQFALRGRGVLQLLAEMARRGAQQSSLVLHRRVLRRRFIERQIHGYRLLLDADDPGISRHLLSRGAREAEQKFVIERVLKTGMTAFDLGANLGYYTVMMAGLVGENGRVYAVEPHPDNFRLLGENVRLNRLANVEIDNIAIGTADGEQELMISEKSNWHSLHVPVLDPGVSWQAKYARTFVGSMQVRTAALPTYLKGKEPVDLLRMDLEGYEVEILKSIANSPRSPRSRMRILFETHPEFYSPKRNDMRGTLEQLCERHGYRFEYLISDYHHGSRREPERESGRRVFEHFGYGAAHIVEQFRNRAVYANLRTADAIELVSSSECVHAALMSPD
jgi:FkbM family methyltransferase